MSFCPLCAEVMFVNSSFGQINTNNPQYRRLHKRLGRSCCGQSICQSCFYRHIRSVWDEGMTGNGRKQLVCPMGCRRVLSDKDIRLCLHNQHADALWNWIGPCLLVIVNWILWFAKNGYYDRWLYFTTTIEERRDLQRYEAWSLALALRSMPSIQRCPGVDCNYAWLIAPNPAYLQSKFDHDRKPVYFWYKPPPPEPGSNLRWVKPWHVKREMGRDGRLMMCAKCHTTFCGLCRRLWNDTNHRRRKRFSHSNVSCATYRSRNPPTNDDDDYAFVSRLANARMCPGCSLRTSRTGGCNHMTCRCGMAWCYVCERPWGSSHNSCRD